MARKTPHFKTPFQIVDGKVAEVEQDSQEEIEQCVVAILRTPVGTRIENPELGIPDEAFEQLGPNPSAEPYLSILEEFEPRARLVGEARLEELATKHATIRPEATQ